MAPRGTKRMLSMMLAAMLCVTASSGGMIIENHTPPFRIEGTSAVPSIDIPMSARQWRYLRAGLNYLEASGIEHPADFVHPGGVAFGSLALTRAAVADVLARYRELAEYALSDAFASRALYEEVARLYADMLLRHYLGVDYWNAPKEAVFEILQRAWYLGPNLYKNGCDIIASRKERAREFLARP